LDVEAIQQQSFPITEARVISSATRQSEERRPGRLVVLTITTVGGAIMGFVFGVLRDTKDRSFRTSRQIGTVLQRDCIAVIPKLKNVELGRRAAFHASQPRRRVKHGAGIPPAEPCARTIMPDCQGVWSINGSPDPRFVEAIRSIKLALTLDGLTR